MAIPSRPVIESLTFEPNLIVIAYLLKMLQILRSFCYLKDPTLNLTPGQDPDLDLDQDKDPDQDLDPDPDQDLDQDPDQDPDKDQGLDLDLGPDKDQGLDLDKDLDLTRSKPVLNSAVFICAIS